MSAEMTALVLFLVFLVIFLLAAYLRLRRRLADTLSRKQSLSVKYGKMTEQFMPFLESYPYDETRFRFIGNPVDGVQFNDDSIVFIEFKSADSRMTREQNRIRQLVDDGKVRFREIRIRTVE